MLCSPLRRITGPWVALTAPLAIPLTILALIVPLPAETQTPPSTLQPKTLQPSALEQIGILVEEKLSRSPAQRKMDSNLVLALRRARRDPRLEALPSLRSPVTATGGDSLQAPVHVEIRAEVTPGLLEEIRARGGEVLSQSSRFRSVEVRMPLAQLENLAAAEEVDFIAPVQGRLLRKVDTSEGDVAHAADLARSNLGVDGTGVKVGVISDGVETLADRQATGDLPPSVTVLPGREGAGREGTAMLEIVFDLAPGAELLFATGGNTPAQMADSILALAAAGARVIVDDVGFALEPVFQDGILAQTVEAVVATGVVYVSSAGNAGNVSAETSGVFEGDYSGTALPAPIPFGMSAADFGTNGFFDSNVVEADAPQLFTLHWADPVSGSGNDYDLYLLDDTGSSVLASSTNFQTGTQDPLEAIASLIPGDPPTPIDHTDARLVVVKFQGEDRFFHLNTHRGELSIGTRGQIAGHAAAASCFGIAAVDVGTAMGGVFPGFQDNPEVESFSSDGPRRVFFEADGTPITPGDFSSTGGRLRAKPDFTAANRVSTSTPGFETFAGTSASAPHVAGIAALLLELGNLTPGGVRNVLESTALDMVVPGVDFDSGFGIVHAENAVGTVSPAVPACFVADLFLQGTPNTGPQVFRACESITAGEGTFDGVTLVAHDGAQPGTVILTSGFSSNQLTVQTTP